MRIQLWSQKPLWWRMDTSEVKTLPNFKGSGRKILPLGWRPFPKRVRSLWIRMNCWKQKNILKKCYVSQFPVLCSGLPKQAGVCIRLVTQSCPTLCDPVDKSPPGFSVHGGGCHVLLQGIFPTQGSNSGFQHCRWILYHLSHQGSTRRLEWVAYPFSRGSSQPRNWTRASCIAGEGNGNWLQYTCLENPMDGGA